MEERRARNKKTDGAWVEMVGNASFRCCRPFVMRLTAGFQEEEGFLLDTQMMLVRFEYMCVYVCVFVCIYVCVCACAFVCECVCVE